MAACSGVSTWGTCRFQTPASSSRVIHSRFPSGGRTTIGKSSARASVAMSATVSMDRDECSMSTRTKSRPDACSSVSTAGERIIVIQVPICTCPRSARTRYALSFIPHLPSARTPPPRSGPPLAAAPSDPPGSAPRLAAAPPASPARGPRPPAPAARDRPGRAPWRTSITWSRSSSNAPSVRKARGSMARKKWPMLCGSEGFWVRLRIGENEAPLRVPARMWTIIASP